MNPFATSLAAAAAVVLALAGPAESATPLSAQDAAFVTKAARGGAAEIADAKLALQTSRNARVDAFAGRMVTDHSQANAQLAAIMRNQGIATPAGLGTENQAMFSKLEALTGADFDSAYFAIQKTAHQETLDLLKKEIAAGKDAALVGFAKRTLPVVQSHMTMLVTGKM